MIIIHATKKLYAKLPESVKVSASEAVPDITADNPLTGWHANLLTLQRRNCALLVHDATRFPLFLKCLLKTDFDNFDRLFADALMNTLLKLDATQDQLNIAAALLAPCRFDTDCNRSVQGTMNQMAGDLEHMLWFDEARLENINSYSTGAWLADRPCTVKGQKGCIWPHKAMLTLLTQYDGESGAANVKSNVVHIADYLDSRDG